MTLIGQEMRPSTRETHEIATRRNRLAVENLGFYKNCLPQQTYISVLNDISKRRWPPSKSSSSRQLSSSSSSSSLPSVRRALSVREIEQLGERETVEALVRKARFYLDAK